MSTIAILLPTGAAMVAGLILLSLDFLRADRIQRRLAGRLDRVTNGLPIQEAELVPKQTSARARFRRPIDVVLGIVGVDPARARDYPLPWWVMLVGAVVLARAIVILVAMIFGGVGMVLWPLFAVLLARFAFGVLHARHSAALIAQFPDTLATIVRCVRVGIPVQEALRIIARDIPAPTAAEFGRIADMVAIGTPLDQAIHDLAKRSRLPEYGFFATALSLQARSGGGLAQTLETLAEMIRKRIAMKARGYALAAEARTSAMILGAIPIVAGLGIELIQPKYLAVLFTTHKGHIIFGLAVFMLGSGVMAMRNIIRRSLS